MTERDDGPPVCELCDQFIENLVDMAEDPDGHPAHAGCLRDEIDQLQAEHVGVMSGRGDLERW